MTHSHEHSHSDNSALNLLATYDNAPKLKVQNFQDEQAHEDAWALYASAKKVLVESVCALLATQVKAYINNAKFVVLYEDRSHDAPHGHIEGIFDANGEMIISGTSDEWHDMDWVSDVDELVWDIYHLNSAAFANYDGRRRFIVELPE